MVVPLILGKMAKDLMDAKITAESENVTSLGIGFVAAFVTGLLACTWMIKLVKISRLWVFSIYCFIVGIVALVAAAFLGLVDRHDHRLA